MIIADTDVLIDYLTGTGAAAAMEEFLAFGTLQTTAVSRFELLSGAREAGHLTRAMKLLRAVPSLPLDTAAADRASEIREYLERSGNAIAMGDCLIAGIVLTNGGMLLTRNRRHFERVPGLRFT